MTTDEINNDMQAEEFTLAAGGEMPFEISVPENAIGFAFYVEVNNIEFVG